MDTRIYVMTRKQIAEISNEIYIPLQIGRAGQEDLGYIGDDTGEHISEKQDCFCELTGMYWLWKNADCDLIGVCHYNRYFAREEKLLDQSYIEETITKYPILIPDSCCVKAGSVYQEYGSSHNGTGDLDICREVIAEKYPEYIPSFDFSIHTRLISAGNMWITRKDIYDRYCSWLFDILFETEKRMEKSKDGNTKTGMAFLAELLFRAWLLMQPEAITEEQVKLIEPEDFQNAEKRVALLYQCVKLKMTPLLQLYRSGAMTGTLAEPFSCQDDFGGKIPVWVCWWQGEREMPELIRCCLESLKRNLPWEKVTLRLITLDNCMEYVTLTDAVIRKFNEGKITFTHLSDILRAELLYRYGGMWIDATYYVAAPVPKELFARKAIYTLKFEKPIWSADITQGRWSPNLWITPKEKKLFQFLMEGLWYYWEEAEELIDYFLIDDIIALAVENFEDVRRELEECPAVSDKVFELHKWMNCKYTKERVEKMQSESVFYKLNRKRNHRKENIAGEKTMFGYLLDGEQN